jgi:hypothetical protein
MVRILALLALLTVPSGAFAQGKLDAVRDEVDKPKSADDLSKSDSCSSDDSSSPGSFLGWWNQGAGRQSNEPDGFLLAVLAPWSLPHALLDPGLETDGRFLGYPFAEARSGLMVLDRPRADGEWHGFDNRKELAWYSARAGIEFGSDFDGLNRVGVRLFLDTDTRIGLKSDWDYYREHLPCGCRDELWFGDLTVTYRFVQNEHVLMHTGAGMRWMFDHGRERAGVNFLYSVDVFPVEPVHLFASLEGGTLGNASLWRARAGVGVNWTHAELFAGYDCLRIGSVSLQGPFVGLRLWF